MIHCQNCTNRVPESDVKLDVDGKRVCSECFVGEGKMLPGKLLIKPTTETKISSKRDVLLDYIVTNANKDWILEFIRIRVIESNFWVTLLEQEPNDRVLLRIATELGYNKGVKKNVARPDGV